MALLLCLVWLPQPAAAQVQQARATVIGVVVDPSGGVVIGADVELLGPQQQAAGVATTDGRGRFRIEGVPPGTYLAIVRAGGFADARASVEVPQPEGRDVTLVTGAAALAEAVTVTATLGEVQRVTRLTQPANVITGADLQTRSKAVVAQAAAEEAGLHVQRTSGSMAGIFVRGLTGSKVNVFVDGVRYSTGAQRGGVSTFFDLIDPATLDSLEILRGPNSAEYGSDALGGSIQFLSRAPAIGVEGARPFGGSFSAGVNSADLSAGSSLSLSYSGPRLGVFAAGAGRRIGDLRAGGGIDSHAAVTRFFGLRSDRLMPNRLPDTGFDQFGGQISATWAPGVNHRFVASYRHGQQEGATRYDQLLGGDGNLVADLRHLTLDLFYVRYERLGAGWFDHASVTSSVNSQREERVNQGGNGNPRNTITHEPERTTALGVQATLRKQLSPRATIAVGGDFYPERVTAPSFGVNPITLASTVRRGRVPDGATYRSGGAFAQSVLDLGASMRIVGNLRVNGASYRARAADSPLVNGRPLWPDDRLISTGLAFRVGLVADPSETWGASASVSRGFRAPHITDLGTLGLTGSGFEVAAPDVAGLGGTVGSTADASAVSTGRPVSQVGPETSLNYEGGLHFRRGGVRSSLSVFANDIRDNIAKQTLILPPGAVGALIGGTPITAQTPNGAVFVAAATNPVLVRANFDHARIVGVEHTFDWRPSPRWAAGTTFTYLHAKDTTTNLPPNIEGGTPAPEGYVRVTYTPPGGRWWAGAYLHAAARQTRLSTLDLEDRRTGATRTRSNIRSFFLNGATARGWVGAGADGLVGTADDVLLATGETLAQIQDRVLGVGVDSSPLFRDVAGFVTVGLRGGIRIGAHEVVVDAENLGDRNYRGISSGMDAPGRSMSIRYVARF